MWDNRAFLVGMFVVPIAVALVAIAGAGEVTTPNAFTAGSTAHAAEVNANFEAHRAGINDNDQRLDILEARDRATHYLSLDSTSFRPAQGPLPLGVTWIAGAGSGGACFDGGDLTLVASVHLPHGSTVTEMTAYFDDTSSEDMWVQLRTEAFDGVFSNRITVGSDANTGRYSRTSGPVTVEIDNQTYGYSVTAVSELWDSALRLKGVVIAYTLP